MARRRPTGGLSVVVDAFRTQLWPVPVAGVLLAVALGVEVPRLDAAFDQGLPTAVSTVLFGGGPDAARTVLSAISGSLITVTSLTFSLTVVTLQLASGQFSPRLLRTFSRDRFVHGTLALFLGTFTYSLVVLRTVRDGGDDAPDFVPRFAVTLAVLATIASVIGLVLFLAHLARQIRVETILDTVHNEAADTMRRSLEQRNEDRPRPVELVPPPPEDARPLLAAESGFLVSIDEDDLVEASRTAGVVIAISGFPGGSLVAGAPIGRYWSLSGEPITEETSTAMTEHIARAVNVGPERTTAQDIAFGLRQLTDVANKALSPGINDPTTAVHALGHISALLCDSLHYSLGPRLLRDDQNRVRVILDRPEFGDLLDTAISEPRRYGSSSPEVLRRLIDLLSETAWHAQAPADRAAIDLQVRRLQTTIEEADTDSTELASLTTAIERVHRSLQHRL